MRTRRAPFRGRSAAPGYDRFRRRFVEQKLVAGRRDSRMLHRREWKGWQQTKSRLTNGTRCGLAGHKSSESALKSRFRRVALQRAEIVSREHCIARPLRVAVSLSVGDKGDERGRQADASRRNGPNAVAEACRSSSGRGDGLPGGRMLERQRPAPFHVGWSKQGHARRALAETKERDTGRRRDERTRRRRRTGFRSSRPPAKLLTERQRWRLQPERGPASRCSKATARADRGETSKSGRRRVGDLKSSTLAPAIGSLLVAGRERHLVAKVVVTRSFTSEVERHPGCRTAGLRNDEPSTSAARRRSDRRTRRKASRPEDAHGGPSC